MATDMERRPKCKKTSCWRRPPCLPTVDKKNHLHGGSGSASWSRGPVSRSDGVVRSTDEGFGSVKTRPHALSTPPTTGCLPPGSPIQIMPRQGLEETAQKPRSLHGPSRRRRRGGGSRRLFGLARGLVVRLKQAIRAAKCGIIRHVTFNCHSFVRMIQRVDQVGLSWCHYNLRDVQSNLCGAHPLIVKRR